MTTSAHWLQQAAVKDLARQSYQVRHHAGGFVSVWIDLDPQQYIGVWSSPRQAIEDLAELNWPISEAQTITRARLQVIAATEELEEWRIHFVDQPIPMAVTDRIVEAARRYLRVVTEPSAT